MATKLIFEQNIEGFSLNEMYGLSQQSISPPPFLLEVGNTYKVVWDGVEYEVVGIDVSSLIEGMVAVGNGTAFGFTGNNEPFIIGTLESDANFFSFDTETSHTVAIYQVVSSGLVLKDRNGNDLESIDGATEMRVPTADGGFRSFTAGERVDAVVNLDFSNGNMDVVPAENTVFKKVTVRQPAELISANIAKGVVIAGIEGNLEGGGTDFEDYISGKMTEITSNADSIGDQIFSQNKAITSVSFPNAESIGESVFNGCTALKSVSFPKLKTIGKHAFTNCTALTYVSFPSVETIGEYAFNYGGVLTADFHKVTRIQTHAFYHYSNNKLLDTLILRTGSVVTLDSTAALMGTFIKGGTGYIYVPSALLESYKTATNWSTYANQFRAIEDYPDICG